MAQQFVTVKTFTYVTEASVLKAKLESEGINCFLKNEHLLSTQQFLSNAIGGLDVQVLESDLPRALNVLKKMEEEEKAASAIPENLGSEFEKVLIYCPDCESSNVYRKKNSFFSFGKRVHVCSDCNHIWKE